MYPALRTSSRQAGDIHAPWLDTEVTQGSATSSRTAALPEDPQAGQEARPARTKLDMRHIRMPANLPQTFDLKSVKRDAFKSEGKRWPRPKA